MRPQVVSKYLGTLLFSLFFFLPSVYGANISINQINSMWAWEDCISGIGMSYNANIEGTTDDGGSGKDYFQIIVTDAYGNKVSSLPMALVLPWPPAAVNLGFGVAAPLSRPITVSWYDTDGPGLTIDQIESYPLLDSITFDPAIFGQCEFLPLVSLSASAENNNPPFNDGRINDWDMGNPIVVYGHDYENGRGLVIYSPNGNLLMELRPEHLINCPTENTLLLESNGVSIYYLSTCEYQLMATSLDGTKTYVMIFREFYPNGYHSYEE